MSTEGSLPSQFGITQDAFLSKLDPLMPIRFGRETYCDLAAAERRE